MALPLDLTNIQDGQDVLSAPVRAALTQILGHLEGMLAGSGSTYAFTKTLLAPTSLVTVDASNNLTVSTNRHRVAAGTTSQINKITGTTDFLVLYFWGTPVTFKHNVVGGNLAFESGLDYTLNSANQVVVFWRNPDTGKYLSINRNTLTVLDFAADVDASVNVGTFTVSATQTRLRLVPSSGTSATIRTISNPSGLDMIFLTPKTAGHTFTLEHNTGNFYSDNGQNITLNSQDQILVLIWNEVVSKWTNVAGSVFSAVASLTYTDSLGTSDTFSTLDLPRHSFSESGGVLRLFAMPRPSRRRAFWTQCAGTTTLQGLGNWATVAASSSVVSDPDSQYLRLNSTAVLGNFCTVYSVDAIIQYRWNPTFECLVQGLPAGTNLDNEPLFLGGWNTPPVVSAGPSISYTGVHGIWIKPYQSGATKWAGQVYFNGAKLGQVLFGTDDPTAGEYRLGWFVNSISNQVTFFVNDTLSSPLSITPGSLTSAALFVILQRGAIAASAVSWDFGRAYLEID